MKCKECENKPERLLSLKGDGWCEVHKMKFFFSERNNPCPICARENNLCDRCGKELKEK